MGAIPDLPALARAMRDSGGLRAKADIAQVFAGLGLDHDAPIKIGDDCAAIPDNDGFLLLAIEGFINEFVRTDPWFAGFCAIMVNVSDIAAMGGRPIAVVDAVWARGAENAEPVLAGMKAASENSWRPARRRPQQSCVGSRTIVGGHPRAGAKTSDEFRRLSGRPAGDGGRFARPLSRSLQ